jgi:Ni,Fe-hydrogenase III small subunit
MFANFARQRSIAVYQLHMGGPDGDAAACKALGAPRFEARLAGLGIYFVETAREADVMLVTGLLLSRDIDYVLREIASLPQPSTVITVGDCATNGGQWAKLEMPGMSAHPLSYYADVPLSVAGDPPAPHDILNAIAEYTSRPAGYLP